MAITSASVCLDDALRRAVAGARLVREDRRVGHQLDVRHRDLRGVRVEDDRAVHLRDLVKERRRVVDLELDAAGVQEAEVFRLADHDQAARAGVQDALDPLPQRGARARSSPAPSSGPDPVVPRCLGLRRIVEPRSSILGQLAIL